MALSASDITLYNRDFVYACAFLGLTRPSALLGDLLNSPSTSSIALGSSLILYPQELVPTACIVGAVTVGGGVDEGTHTYKYTFVTPEGETTPSLVSNNAVTTAANKTVAISGILPGSGRVTSRKLYRNSIAVPAVWRLCATIAGNITTTASDVATDAAIVAAAVAPTVNTTSNVFLSGVPTGAGTTSYVMDTVASNDKILSIRNTGVEKLSVDLNGSIVSASSVYAGVGTYSNTFASRTATTLDLYSSMVDGAAAIAVRVNCPAYVNATAKLVSFQNNSVEKSYIDKDGRFSTFQLSALDAAFGAPGASFVIALSGVSASNAVLGNRMYVITSTVDAFVKVDGPATTNGQCMYLPANTPRNHVFSTAAAVLHAITTGAEGNLYCTLMTAITLP